AAAVQSAGALLLGYRAHDKRAQAGEQRSARGRSNAGIFANRTCERSLVAVAKKRAEHSRSAVNKGVLTGRAQHARKFVERADFLFCGIRESLRATWSVGNTRERSQQ